MKKFIAILFISIFCTSTFAQSYERTDLGVKSVVESTNIEIQFYSPAIVRVIKSPVGTPKESFSVIKQPEKTLIKLIKESNVLQLKSQSLCVNLNLLTGQVSFEGLDRRPLLVEKNYFIQATDSKANQPTVQWILDKNEPVYGLGQQQEGKMNLRGESIRLQQENTKIAIPFFQSVKGYGVFWDNYGVTLFTDNPNGTTFSSETGEGIDYYFLYGQSMDGTIACMRDLTGQVPLFPLWTWGYWQSRERYVSQKELIETVERYRHLQVPLDGIVQDWQYWSTDNAYWNGIEFNNPEFPDPVQMVSDIHRLHAHAIISVWPSFGTRTKPYQTLKEKGMLLDFESFPQSDSVRVYDAFNAQARAVYWDFMDRYLFTTGMDGWWLDATEPEASNMTEAQLNQPTAAGRFREVRNAFPLLSVGGVYEHQRKVSEEKRVYILTRSAFAGQQRYASNSWSGDINGDWETFRKQIPAGLNFSLCGLPYWNTDIGGFWVRDGSSQYSDYRELYVRWLQFGAFMPMMRSHGTNTPREIWQFGQKGDWAYDAIEKYIQLRYSLLPYNYSLSWDVTAHAGSVLRMLSMDFPQDKNVWDMGTEYLYGKSLLIVPVTQPFYAKGEKANSTIDFAQIQTYPVYLPEGSDWYDFWTNEKFVGGTNLQRETPIDILPVYVKSGSIIPFGPDVQYAEEKDWQHLELRVYPGADAEFVLYEDEKDNYHYEKGIYSTIKIQWNDSNRTLTIGDRLGKFPGMLEKRTFRVVLIGEEKEKTEIIQYQGKSLERTLDF
ncbi:MAG: Alpha-xylosidase BoGH31A [Candidatus Ordinivivax streblomastigis]|uniref:Alpha-xylosidase BoGH31A n=1 Tax=Candidatus Ordinivivax streblomastigis TaxID=2540710 RepID=A0A5M8P405_9BACT|nr:MAG: Alpha-xylosidase BoGH31A [Candidatus Ordinivivax streblomastigis]